MGRLVTRISLEVFPTCLALFSSQAENKAEQSDVYLTEGRANKSDYTDDLIFCACKARGFSHHKGFSFFVRWWGLYCLLLSKFSTQLFRFPFKYQLVYIAYGHASDEM